LRVFISEQRCALPQAGEGVAGWFVMANVVCPHCRGEKSGFRIAFGRRGCKTSTFVCDFLQGPRPGQCGNQRTVAEGERGSRGVFPNRNKRICSASTRIDLNAGGTRPARARTGAPRALRREGSERKGHKLCAVQTQSEEGRKLGTGASIAPHN
jgi:hypothetical protein